MFGDWENNSQTSKTIELYNFTAFVMSNSKKKNETFFVSHRRWINAVDVICAFSAIYGQTWNAFTVSNQIKLFLDSQANLLTLEHEI